MSKLKSVPADHEVVSLLTKLDVPEVKGDQPLNPYTELQIFQTHTDIVRLLLRIDSARFASAADDCQVIIWDIEINQRVHVLRGHSRPVSCLSLLNTQKQQSEVTLLTGASDKLICLWGVETGLLLRTVTSHQGPVRCLASLNKKNAFCAAGETLSVWTSCGKLLTKLDRTEEEDIQHIIVLGEDTVVAAADKDLSVFKCCEREELDGSRTCSLQLAAKLQKHPDSIRCLSFISDTVFASGSLDGTVVVWSFREAAWHQLWEHVDPRAGEKTTSSCSVQAMLPLAEKCLVVAVGCGFAVFDIVTGKLLTERPNAHRLKILHLQFIKDRATLLTCSEDGGIRIWGRELNSTRESCTANWDKAIDHFLNLTSHLQNVQLDLLGECLGHTGPVHMMVQFGRIGFVSCGVDTLVMAWKDGELEELKRREIIANCLVECPAAVV